MFETDWNNL